ncbi:MAG: chromosome segregation protein SMC [Burkholderiales bacterium]|nr:chromosome segregation protein SMC [Burkholderiales bacterium]
MRLTQIKLAGFKSFVDPTTIATPGQLVGIVGPNGCGKSNVIDAVRWVLGESKASALRGESMQDVIFSGAGERKPVGRASVELHFDNSLGRIGGQWGQYAEISLKRVLTRDGDSTYYINNIPVRRRDIHDLFLGTGLGPRAYAIIEQGMISRVIEAKPEELRIFLEEAAGVSKYKERRKETEGRLADTRENLSRVEDIRLELAAQLERLEQQAQVAGQYRELTGRLTQAQHLLWFARQQDAARSREKCAAEIVTLTNALEAIRADIHAAEAGLEALRAEHFTAGDDLHDKQGAFYAANAEVSRLEQQLGFARDSQQRIETEVARLGEALAAIAGLTATLVAEREQADAALVAATETCASTAAAEVAAKDAMPPLTAAVGEADAALTAQQQTIAQVEQVLRVAETRRDSVTAALRGHAERRARLEKDLAEIAAPASDLIRDIEEQLAQETADLTGKEEALAALAARVEALQARQRSTADAWEQANRTLTSLTARQQALAALQAKIGRGGDVDAWLATHGLTEARRLYQALDIEPGWEDALEAVLRERLSAIEVEHLDGVAAWTADGAQMPRRVAAYAPEPVAGERGAHPDALLTKVRHKRPEVARAVADGLAGIQCCPDLATALARRGALGAGEAFVTAAGHLVTAQTVAFFAPDHELHGVVARERELDELAATLDGARAQAHDARALRDAVAAELAAAQHEYRAEGLAVGSQQRRVHDLELELVQLREAATAADRRRQDLTRDLDELARRSGEAEAQRRDIDAEIADGQSRLHDEHARREHARAARNEAEVALAKGREALRHAERAAQEAGFAQRRCRDHLAELDRRHADLRRQEEQQQGLVAKLSSERAAIDWAPVEASLTAELARRANAEAALAAARDRLEALAAQLRAAEEARLAADQRLEPARARIQDMQLKEQAAALAAAQFGEQLDEAHADLAALPDALKAWGSARTLPAEIERLNGAIGELGAVNLAALDELTQARERKDYLDRQAADLTEAMGTLETAIRQIDRESRELLAQTFATVNDNFSRIFPTLFGGGTARLVLTGEEILDSGVQVVAQPPGKRNTSIHLLSGGEKALTAISLVFALFQLNPAPFCLLDEVDAPLDDPNTDRFCAMVKEMSQTTQFLFISHNKITMEMAHQLVGITMAEPGASRVVAVDIAEALSLAAA